MEPLGILFGLLAAMFWGSYLVPVKTVKVPEGDFTLAMGAGMGLMALAVSPWVLDLMSSPTDLALALLAGVIWSGGNVCSLYAVRGLGFARAVALFSIAVVVNALFGVLFFGELGSDTMRVALLFGGIGILLLGVVLALSTYGSKGNTKVALIWIGLMTGLLFGSYNAPIRATTVGPATATAGLFLGMVLTTVVLGLLVKRTEKGRSKGPRVDRRRFLMAMTSGVIWGVGTAFSIYSIDLLGLAVSFPIFQMNVMIYIGWGVFYFKEVEARHHWRIVLGAILLFLGAWLVISI